MIEVIPTIIAKDFQELREKIKRVEPYVEWAQLDVMDGKFVDNLTWDKSADLEKLEIKLNLEVHLMVENPENMIGEWIESRAKRLIVHFESSRKIKEVIKRIKDANLGAGLAINPQTPIEVVDDFILDLDLILVMTVEPGRGGQKLIEDTLVKIKRLRDVYPNVKIEADGGINLETAPKAVRAGADTLAIGSAIFGSRDIEKTINELERY